MGATSRVAQLASMLYNHSTSTCASTPHTLHLSSLCYPHSHTLLFLPPFAYSHAITYSLELQMRSSRACLSPRMIARHPCRLASQGPSPPNSKTKRRQLWRQLDPRHSLSTTRALCRRRNRPRQDGGPRMVSSRLRVLLCTARCRYVKGTCTTWYYWQVTAHTPSPSAFL